MDIVKVPDPILKKTVNPVKAEDLKSGKHAQLIETMRHDMVNHNGIGLAGNQVGRDLAVFVIDKEIAAEHGIGDVFANPEVTGSSRELDELEEGCLSIPEFWVPITRSKKIMFKALDEKGNKVKFRARGMLARVLQHETDHLNGLTIKDRAKE